MMTQSAISVPFHGVELYIVTRNDEPYTPMKPIVEGMGMIWAAQFVKLKQRFTSTISEIEIVADDGKSRKMLCLPLRKLAGWLQTISPNKVKPEIRDKVIQYQDECDDVLYKYWTKGEVINPRKKKPQSGQLTIEQQEAIKQLVLTRGKSVPHEHQGKATITLWSALKSHFGCSYKEIPEDNFTEALSLAARVPIKGEFIDRASSQNSLPAISGRIVIDYEDGSVTRTEVVASNCFIGNIETLFQYLEKRGVVVLTNEDERRSFVKENLMRLIN
ncbi:phage antirepressor N-terminal domain-containing protein [Symbiopectobacterium purcellii]|uniref:Phage antirepressor N-terminal domain-containing protein n=1 Tax=Symbiopectobacterium purcellii TaxID=2871826 RepID=A0ABX9ANJ8_9ENTR|nr:phage antirepressor N-terminal domain-containing protein [Symbiopectobacterium purcellii]QZN96371.1 phage antirepressor N-terminal domain-containing protein [Symbiopectobacterium purcellii]